MAKTVGVWIDHKAALLVSVSDRGETVKRVSSNVKTQLKQSSQKPREGRFEPENVRARAMEQHLNRYYDKVAGGLRDAEAILVFGPGKAKDEFKKRLEKMKLTKRITQFATADKMTDRQFAAKVRALAGK